MGHPFCTGCQNSFHNHWCPSFVHLPVEVLECPHTKRGEPIPGSRPQGSFRPLPVLQSSLYTQGLVQCQLSSCYSCFADLREHKETISWKASLLLLKKQMQPTAKIILWPHQIAFPLFCLFSPSLFYPPFLYLPHIYPYSLLPTYILGSDPWPGHVLTLWFL